MVSHSPPNIEVCVVVASILSLFSLFLGQLPQHALLFLGGGGLEK